MNTTVLLVVAGACLIGLVVFFFPTPPVVVESGRAPALTYAEARDAIDALLANPPPNIRPECRGRLYDHGFPTSRVFVLLHGLTNCPKQYEKLAQAIFDRGYNVLLPRTPYHGDEDRLTRQIRHLTSEQMILTANTAVDLAKALGDRVTVVGLSINGATAAWLAQQRDDLDEVVLLAPFLAPAGVSRWLRIPLEHVLLRVPNIFVWWDAEKRADLPGVAYPRFPTRVIGEVMRLGNTILDESSRQGLRARRVVIVTTENDRAADNGMTSELVAVWKRDRPESVTEFVFPADQKIPHDFVDPTQPDARVDEVYPVLLRLMGL